MIVLDTNVVSELMRASPNKQVVTWLDLQPTESVWTTSVNVFEILFGLKAMPLGNRKQRLLHEFERALEENFDGRVLSFDVAAATEAATISDQLKRSGQPVDFRDVQIAGIVSARRGILATRNIKHFLNSGLSLINPWEDGPGLNL